MILRAAIAFAALLASALALPLPASAEERGGLLGGLGFGGLFGDAPPPAEEAPEERLARHPLADREPDLDAPPLPGATSVRMPFPFFTRESGGGRRLVAFHPLFSVFQDESTGRHDVHVLWPIFRYSRQPESWHGADRRMIDIFPFYVNRWSVKDGERSSSRLAFPLYMSGTDKAGQRYFILAPFIWHADEARVPVFFPPRPQTFSAVWPLAGEFRDFWNRDRIQFLLWPLFVRSWKGDGDDRVEMHAMPWPFLSLYSGPRVSGFRVWPLYARVRMEGEFTRSYWLWPLGHYRDERPDERGRFRRGTIFFPFYANYETQDLRYRLHGPFHGRLEMKGRTSRGWLLGIYNEDENHRTGVRRHRLIWFIVRWWSPIPVREEFLAFQSEEEARSRGVRGGGVFPVYVRTHTGSGWRQTVLWPVFVRAFNRYPGGESFDRTTVILFHYQGTQRRADGSTQFKQMFWPVYRRVRTWDGHTRENALHFVPLVDTPGADRNLVPLLAFWSSDRHAVTGERKDRWLGGVVSFDRDWRGVERRRFDTLLFTTEATDGPNRPRESRTTVLRGLVGRYRLGDEVRTELLWMRF